MGIEHIKVLKMISKLMMHLPDLSEKLRRFIWEGRLV